MIVVTPTTYSSMIGMQNHSDFLPEVGGLASPHRGSTPHFIQEEALQRPSVILPLTPI